MLIFYLLFSKRKQVCFLKCSSFWEPPVHTVSNLCKGEANMPILHLTIVRQINSAAFFQLWRLKDKYHWQLFSFFKYFFSFFNPAASTVQIQSLSSFYWPQPWPVKTAHLHFLSHKITNSASHHLFKKTVF